jgi:hypothetical protein
MTWKPKRKPVCYNMAEPIQPEQLARNGTEHGEQAALFCWATLPATREAYPALYNAQGHPKLFAVNNNAGMGDAVRGARAKMAGVRKGVADTMLPLARHGMHGLFVEMKQRKFKTRKDGGLKPEQIEFKHQVLGDGFGYVAAYGWEEAAEVIKQYLAP